MPIHEFRSTREGYGDALFELGKKQDDVFVVCADLTKSTDSQKFAEAFPKRFVQAGVAEQNMIAVAAGIASTGKTVFATSYAAFNPGRNFDFIRTQVCYSNLNVKIIGSHAGLSDGPDGATHQMLEDVALTRCLPNMTVLSPCDYWEANKAVGVAYDLKGPFYIRLYRESTKVITNKESTLTIGKWNTLSEGNGVCIITHGVVASEVLKAKELLKEKSIDVEIVSACSIKPLDVTYLKKASEKFSHIVVVEEHQKAGGLGGAVCEYLSEINPTKVLILAMDNKFGQSGKYHELLEKYKLNARGITDSVLELIKDKINF